MDFFDKDKTNLIISITNTILLTVIIIITVITLLKVPKNKIYVEEDTSTIEEIVELTDPISEEETISEEIIVSEQTTYKVDIKGAVKTPGVYTVNSNAIINDVINLAGGLKNNASTKYLNLSKKVTDEMVINVYTSYEISQMNATPKEECTTNSEVLTDCKNASTIVKKDSEENKDNSLIEEQNKKVSINNGTKEELMTLSGIGEAKANAIIEYRNANGPFKTLEDIINVSGIGKEAFEKIKDNIEL